MVVDPPNTETRRAVDRERDAVGGVERDRVRVAELELQLGRSLGQDAIPHADDLEPLLVAVRHTLDHVGDQCAGQAVQRLALTLVVGTGDLDHTVLATPDGDRSGDVVPQGALGALHRHQAFVDGDVDTGRDRDGKLANARHALLYLSLVSTVSGYQT